MFDIKKEVLNAHRKIRPYIKETPLDYSPSLSQQTKAEVFLKCENLQHTGAFKIRGALNKLLNLTPLQQKQGVVTASSGNHGAAVAFGLQKFNMKGLVFVPDNASAAKVDNIRNYTQNLHFYGNDCVQTELHALEYAKEHQMIYISPYNDYDVISGQGTIAVELIHQLETIDAIYVPIGGAD